MFDAIARVLAASFSLPVVGGSYGLAIILLPLAVMVVLVAFAAMRERLAHADVPLHFRGAPIALVTAGLMALAFMGFTGLAKL